MTVLDGQMNAGALETEQRPGFAVEHEGNVFRLRAHGDWTIQNVVRLQRDIDAMIMPTTVFSNHVGELEVSGLQKLDVAGAWLIYSTLQHWCKRGLDTSFINIKPEHRTLLDEVDRLEKAGRPKIASRSALQRLLDDVAGGLAGIGGDAVLILGFLGSIFSHALYVLIHPSRMRWTAFIHQLEHVGFRAVGIISLICFLIGAVILQQGVVQLRYYGAEPFAVNMLAILTLREVGVLLTAIIIAGRSGSAFTAEIGSMKMREEVDAMRTIGLNPVEVLVLPRVIALLIAVPVLALFADLMCLLGGGVMASAYVGLDWDVFLDSLHGSATVERFMVGMVKTPFIAMIIAIVGCMEGFKVEGSAESLGYHVTVSVVKAIFLVIVVDALFAIFLAAMGY